MPKSDLQTNVSVCDDLQLSVNDTNFLIIIILLGVWKTDQTVV